MSYKSLALAGALAVILCFSCSCDSMNSGEYVGHVTDYANGMHVRTNKVGLVFDVQYVAQGLRRVNNQDWFDSLEHFLLKISLPDSTTSFLSHGSVDVQSHQQRLYYFSYLFQNDVYLENDLGRRSCVLFHFQPSSGNETATFTLAFEPYPAESKAYKFVIDSPFISSIPVKLLIDKSKLP